MSTNLNIKGIINSYLHICTSLFPSNNKKSKLNSKVQLSLLREFCIYISIFETKLDVDIVASMINFLKALSDSADVDRKIFRVCLFLLVETISIYCTMGENHILKSHTDMLHSFMVKELLQQKLGSKKIIIWRNLSSIEDSHLFVPNNIISNASLLDSDTFTRLCSAIEVLEYPVLKEKKSKGIFGSNSSNENAEKDHMLQLHHWATIFSSLFRCGKPLPPSCWSNLMKAISCQNYLPLAQHAFRVLYQAISSLNDDSESQIRMLMILETNAASIKDPLCCSLCIRSISKLTTICKDFDSSNTTTDRIDHQCALPPPVGSDIGNEIISVFSKLCKMFLTESMR